MSSSDRGFDSRFQATFSNVTRGLSQLTERARDVQRQNQTQTDRNQSDHTETQVRMAANRLRQRHECTWRRLKRETVLAPTRSGDLSHRDALADTDCRKSLCSDPLHRFLVSSNLLHDGWRRAIKQRFPLFVKEVKPYGLPALQIVEIGTQLIRTFSFIHARRFFCFHRHDAVQRYLPAIFVEAREQRGRFQRRAHEHDDHQKAEKDF